MCARSRCGLRTVDDFTIQVHDFQLVLAGGGSVRQVNSQDDVPFAFDPQEFWRRRLDRLVQQYDTRALE